MFNEYCDRLQNRLIFPAISSIFICLLYYVDQGYCRMIFAGFFLFFSDERRKVGRIHLYVMQYIGIGFLLDQRNRSD